MAKEPESLVQFIAEEEFLPFVQETSRGFFRTINSFKFYVKEQSDVSKKFYSHLVQESEFLESFLDEHGARENKTWVNFSEYVASIRNLGISAFLIRHLLDRYPYYNLDIPEEVEKEFYLRTDQTLVFLNQSILSLFEEIEKSAKVNGLEVPSEGVKPSEFPEFQSNKKLPKNISEDRVKDEQERVIDLCGKVRNVAKMIKEVKIEFTEDLDQLRKLIPDIINEKNSRMYSNVIHSVQSDYDTYVKNTRIEYTFPDLKNIRGCISLALHLQEISLWLCHFYERHEDDIRQGGCKETIASLVDKNTLFSSIINFAFKLSLAYIQEGARLSEEILTNALEIVRYELPIPQPHGFHARPSTYLTLIAKEHNKDVFLLVDDEKFSLKSVMSLLQAGGLVADKGYMMVTFEGDKKTLDDIKILAESNYCESEEIPAGLEYLKALTNSSK
jgi:phosphotransferase system HPr-like phosphotransfer protein